MTSTISVRIGKPIIRELSKIEKKWKTDRSEVVRRLLSDAISEWKIKVALEEISEHKVSVGKAAEECGISLWEMLDLVKKKNIDWVDYNEEDLERDLENLK
tara:strand:+ start:3627 stop:3929 length:303 start_codon:yes stop_codon:yes gene_type:complete